MASEKDEHNSNEEIDFRDYLVYTPQEEYIDYPRRIYGGKNERKTSKKMKKHELIKEFKKVFSEINAKVIKDDDLAYYVLEFHSSPISSKYERILKRMQINLLSFLDKNQKTALVQSSFDIEGTLSTESRDIIKSIRLHSMQEKVEDTLRGKKSKEQVIINTIPNIPVERIHKHLSKIRNYINQHGGQNINSLIDKTNLRGSVIAYTDGRLIERLGEDSDIIFSVYTVPEMILLEINKRKKKKQVVSNSALVASTLNISENEDTYEIIEIRASRKNLAGISRQGN